MFTFFVLPLLELTRLSNDDAGYTNGGVVLPLLELTRLSNWERMLEYT